MLDVITLALGVAGGGHVALLLAQAVEPSGGGVDLAPWLQGGGSAAAVGGLVYVAHQIARGNLVPRDVARREAEMADAAEQAAAARSEAVRMVTDAHIREAKLEEALTQVAHTLGEVTAEMRYWRDRRGQGGGR